MEELQKPWGNMDIFEWYFSDDNERAIMLPIGNTNAINIISALETVRDKVAEQTEESTEFALETLYALAEIIIANAYDIGDEMAEEFIVSKSISNMDSVLDDILKGKE